MIICTGAPLASGQAMDCVDRGGSILFFAVPGPDAEVSIKITDFWRNEISVMTSYGAAPMDLDASTEIISERRIDVRDMITHRLGLAEAQLGFSLVAGAQDCLKVVIEPWR